METFRIKVTRNFLVIPVNSAAEPCAISIYADGNELYSYTLRIASDEVENWMSLDVSAWCDKEIVISCSDPGKLSGNVFFRDSRMDSCADDNIRISGLYFAPYAQLGKILDLKKETEAWHLYYDHDACSAVADKKYTGHISTTDFLHWEQHPNGLIKENNGGKMQKALAVSEQKQICCTVQKGIYKNNLLHCYELHQNGEVTPVSAIENLRVWERNWSEIELMTGTAFCETLKIRVAPEKFPDIKILPAEGLPNEISTETVECILKFAFSEKTTGSLNLCGLGIALDGGSRTLSIREKQYAVKPGEMVKLHIVLEKNIAAIYAFGECFFAALQEDERNDIIAADIKGRVCFDTFRVYGLRSVWTSEREAELIRDMPDTGRLFYETEHYKIYDNYVEDYVYGKPAAFVPDAKTIISPQRVPEEFSWRGGYGVHMTRVCSRDNVWHPHYEICKFPRLETGWNTVDAAYNLALDVFLRCTSHEGEYAWKGQEGMWAAGFFQGPKNGFGVWVRDTTHTGIRCGNLLDPDGARRSLLYTTNAGFDNGIDGVGLPIVGIWDYYLATGDMTLIREVWSNLLLRIARLEKLYEPDTGLFFADRATSNDAFPEPENGNHSLSTEIYFVEAFACMAKMGRLMRAASGDVEKWERLADITKEKIRNEYWNEEAGYFTSGPKGTEGFERRYFELCGAEAALWPKFSIATEKQRERFWDSIPENAINDFGMNVFSYREEVNHFCNAAWVAWTCGIAAAANKDRQSDFLTKLIAQQVRNGVTAKTFYEVIDFKTGKAWRWPGQLWQAVGFVSYFMYGILGLEYQEDGLFIHPVIPKQLKSMKLMNVKFRAAVIDFVVKGHGKDFDIKLNGISSAVIPADAKGHILCEIIAK